MAGIFVAAVGGGVGVRVIKPINCAAAVLALLLCAAVFGRLFAGERRSLSGSLTGDLVGGEYLVKSVLVVPVGDTLRIAAGAALYFEQLTGIDVSGALSIGGTPEKPVVLTSSNDVAGAAEAAHDFDWNGIRVIGPAASLSISHAFVGNSVYGLNIVDTLARAELVEVAFRNNGYASLVRGGEIIPVGEAVSVSWGASSAPPERVSAASAVKPAKAGRRVGAKFVFNAGAVTVAAAGMTACYIALWNTNTYYKHYLHDDNSSALMAYYEGKIRKNITVSAVGAAVAGVGIGCVGVSLFF